MIAVIMTYQRSQRAEEADLFARFTASTPGVVHAYQLEDGDNGATVTIWESKEARDAYMKSALKNEVDAALPSLSRRIYTVRDSK